MNVKLEYLYRDAGNFKNWNEVVFSNPKCIAIEFLDQRTRKILIDGNYFVAKKADIPDLHFPDYDIDLDHDWHEFFSITATSDPVDDKRGRDIEEFLGSLVKACEI